MIKFLKERMFVGTWGKANTQTKVNPGGEKET